MFGWLADPAALGGRDVALAVTLPDVDRAFGLLLGDGRCSLGEVPQHVDGALTASGEAWLRLVIGRLAPERTPAGVEVTGDVPLATLRQAFPASEWQRARRPGPEDVPRPRASHRRRSGRRTTDVPVMGWSCG